VGDDADSSGRVDVRAARIPDRNRLLRELTEAGLDARPVGELEIEVICTDIGDEAAQDDILARAEQLIESVGAAFIPVKRAGVIYTRPPIG